VADEKVTASPQVDPGGVQAAIDRFRDLAKYLITIFAAVGGLLVAGTQLTSIGSLQWPENEGRIVVGGLGFFFALLAAAVIVVKALNVLQPIETSFDRVREKVGRGEVMVSLQLLRPYDSVEQLAFVIESAEAAEPGSPAYESLLGQAAEIVDKVAYDEVAARFKVARNWMIGGALAGTVAIVTLVWAANPPKSETAEPVIRPVPVEVTVSLTKAGREVLGSSLGKDCDTDRIEAVSIGGTESTPRILVTAANGCHLAQFSLPPNWGKATSTRPAPSHPHAEG
jgi:hypothetical protein